MFCILQFNELFKVFFALFDSAGKGKSGAGKEIFPCMILSRSI